MRNDNNTQVILEAHQFTESYVIRALAAGREVGRPTISRCSHIVKIQNPKFLCSGYNAWFDLLALIVVCRPLLFASIEAALQPQESLQAAVIVWALVLLLVSSAVFLACEFFVQIRFFFVTSILQRIPHRGRGDR